MTANEPAGDSAQRRLILLGSTGSIGTNVIEVIEHLRAQGSCAFEVIGLSAARNVDTLREQADRFGVRHVAIADPLKMTALDGVAHVYAGPDSALELVSEIAQPGDLVVGAMVGSAGVPATLAAIDRGCDVALANKETLVAAGALVVPRVRERGVTLLPIDSEHSAIFQCLLAGRSIEEVRRLVLTASGGPFRTWSHDATHAASVADALKHPTWTMGRKITIDSASLMNKGLEIIEAHWLFDLPAERIDVIIHPQSIVHSFVEFVDGSVLAQLGPPDMRTPIQYALTWPHRVGGCGPTMDWQKLCGLEFESLDRERFPAAALAADVIRTGGTAGAVFNAANEAAVEAFLAGRIPFGVITQLVGDALQALETTPVRTLEDVRAADFTARRHVTEALQAVGTR